MGFDNKYPNRKDWRDGYHKSGKYDASCRPGGSCPYCRGNRQIGDKKRELKTRDAMDDIREAVHTVFHKGGN
jgi:hypothetical protein